MNLHQIARGAITRVNDDIAATYLKAKGSNTLASGKRVPTYDAPLPVRIQVQPVTGSDIERLNNLGIQGILRKVYDYGNQCGIVRVDEKGGDLLQFPQVPGADVNDWKVVSVAETWPDWSAVIVALQTS